MEKNSLYIIIIAFLVGIIIYQFVTVPDFSEIEQEKNLLLKQNNQLQFKIISFEKEIIKNDSIIDHSTIHEIDSLFADYFKSK